MSNVVPVNNKIIVERNDKAKKKKDASNPFDVVVSSNNLGIVKYSSTEDYPVGSSVYFGNETEELLIDGAPVLAMNVDNLIAKVVE